MWKSWMIFYEMERNEDCGRIEVPFKLPKDIVFHLNTFDMQNNMR